MVHHSAKYNSEDNLLEDKKILSNKVNETEKPFKDSLNYPSNPLNPSNPQNPLNPLNPSNPPNPWSPSHPPNPSSPSNPLSPSHPPNPCPHPPNPRFKDSQQLLLLLKLRQFKTIRMK